MVTILVVEDEKLVARDIQNTLGRLGYLAPATAGTGQEALAKTAELRPDLVLMDIRLRGDMDGVETARALTARYDLPVVYLTAYGDDETLERAKTTAPFGFLLKPFTERDLKSAIDVALFKHQADTAVKKRERWYSTTLESIDEGVITTDASGNITTINGAAVELLGRPREALLGQPADEALGVIEDGERSTLVGEVLEKREPTRSARAGRLSRSGGRTLLVESSAAPILSGSDVLGVVVVIRDVSDRVQLEERLVIAERLSSLGTMASGIAHEINNPLAYVLANVEYTREELEQISIVLDDIGDTRRLKAGSTINEKLHALMESMQEATDGAKRVRGIVSDLRSFTLVKQASQAPFRLEDAVARAIRICRTRAKPHARLVVDLTPVPYVIGDESRLTQVLVNLVSNGIDAIPEGSPKDNQVRVTCHVAEDGRVALVVEDTGVGMSAETLRRVFDPFFTTKPQGTGMGLGLAISHRMITDMGGELVPESVVGQGTTMTILLKSADG